MAADPLAAADPLGPAVLKLRARDELTAEEESAFRAAIGEVRDYDAGRTMVRSGVALTESCLQISGISCRYKDLADGQRQILELHVAGDFVDLHSFLLKRLEHSVAALTPTRIAAVPHAALKEITERHPHLARMLWFSTLLDAAIHREKIVSVGRRSAIARVAHLLCELYVRLEIVGLAAGGGFPLPLTQTDLADASGLTSVHVNRMLKKLRDGGLVTFRNGEVAIHDWEGLQRVAEFSPSYLFTERQER